MITLNEGIGYFAFILLIGVGLFFGLQVYIKLKEQWREAKK